MKIIKASLISIFSLSILFHLMVIVGFIDFHIVWGGRLTNQSEMLAFESVSIIINLFFLMVVLFKTRVIQHHVSEKKLNFILWLMIALFALNTLGNLASQNTVEKLIFTPITGLLVFLILRLLQLSKQKQSST